MKPFDPKLYRPSSEDMRVITQMVRNNKRLADYRERKAQLEMIGEES